MRKWFALCATVLAIGCGGPAASEGDDGAVPNEPEWMGPTGTISLAAMPEGTTLAKVIARRGELVPTPVIDDEGEQIGTEQVFTETFRYVTNVAGASINLPEGVNYTLEVIARDASGDILGYFKSDYFDVSDTTPAAPALPPGTMPTLTVPEIYVGMAYPYDTFTVAVSGVAEPFVFASSATAAPGGEWLTSTNATKVCVQISPAPAPCVKMAQTFQSPTAAGTLNFVGKFRLHPSVLINGEDPDSWKLDVTASQPTEAFGTVDIVP